MLGQIKFFGASILESMSCYFWLVGGVMLYTPGVDARTLLVFGAVITCPTLTNLAWMVHLDLFMDLNILNA